MDTIKVAMFGDSILRFVKEERIIHPCKKYFRGGYRLNEKSSQDVLSFLENFSNLKILLLHIGTNNLYDKEKNLILDDHFYNMYRTLINEVLDRYPNLVILISSVLPRVAPNSKEVVFTVNEKLRSIAKEYNKSRKVQFIASYKSFIDNKKSIKSNLYIKDNLHLSVDGVKELTSVFNVHLSNISVKGKKK